MGVSFLGIQETCMSKVDLFWLKILWGNFSFDFATSSACGLSGGILSIWDPLIFIKKKVFSTEHAIIVEGDWVFFKFLCYMISVYAPQEPSKKKLVWEFLS